MRFQCLSNRFSNFDHLSPTRKKILAWLADIFLFLDLTEAIEENPVAGDLKAAEAVVDLITLPNETVTGLTFPEQHAKMW